ncbi:MAG: aromatic amino acid lyase [Planctomycetota bacterium]
MADVTLSSRFDIDLASAWKVGYLNHGIQLSTDAIDKIEKGRRIFEQILDSDRCRYIYGITTGPGSRAHSILNPEAQNDQGLRLIDYLPSRVGTGGRCLSHHVSRIAVMARLSNYLDGYGKIRAETVEKVVGLLEHGDACVPFDSANGPGEVLPLSFLLSPMSGCELAPGEAMALINGAPFAVGMVTDVALTARRRLILAVRVFVMAIEGANACLDHYSDALLEVIEDGDLRTAIRMINELLDGVPPNPANFTSRPGQAPVSFRVLPNILASAVHAVGRSECVATTSMQTVADNPIFLPPNDKNPDGQFISSGGFHNHQASRAIDGVNASLADLCSLASKQIARLLDGQAFGLPPLLIPPGSGIIGMEYLAWIQNSHAERAKDNARPSVLSLGLEDPHGGQADVASFTFTSYERYLEASEAFDASMATLAIAASQALLLTDRPAPPKLSALHDAIREVAPLIDTKEAVSHLGSSLHLLRDRFAGVVDGQQRDLESALLGDLPDHFAGEHVEHPSGQHNDHYRRYASEPPN